MAIRRHHRRSGDAVDGTADVMELYAFAYTSGVEIRNDLLPREKEQADRAASLISRLMRDEEAVARRAGQDLTVR